MMVTQRKCRHFIQ